MKQAEFLDNAFRNIACLHSIYNQPVVNTQMLIGPDRRLAQFQTANANQSPHKHSSALEQFQQIRTRHRTFAQKGQSTTTILNQDDVHHHFVAFVVWQGQ